MSGIMKMSPWKAPQCSEMNDFGDGLVRTLEQILTLCTDKSRTYYIGDILLRGCSRYGHHIRQMYFPALHCCFTICLVSGIY